MDAHEEKYSKAKTVHSIMRHCAERVEVNLEVLYNRIAWPLVRKGEGKFGDCHDAFVKAIRFANKLDACAAH